jgi:hypothetical protein
MIEALYTNHIGSMPQHWEFRQFNWVLVSIASHGDELKHATMLEF